MVQRLMELGHSEDEANRYVETYSIVSKFAFDEPVNRWFLDIQLELFENRSQRQFDKLGGEIQLLLQRVDLLMAELGVEHTSSPEVEVADGH